jgi:hypothetical protein
MAKNISTGIDKTVEALNKRQEDELNKAWRMLRNKLDSLLLSTNVLKTNDSMRACRELDGMTPEERALTIQQKWGPQYYQKAHPMLVQLELIEKNIAATASDSNET